MSKSKSKYQPPLPSLIIKGFKGFKELTIPNLGRVTLLVGENSIGKTSVIEAIRVYAERGQFTILSEILKNRSEVKSVKDEDGNDIDISDFGTLFYGRDSNQTSEIIIGPVGKSSQLKIKRTFLSSKEISFWYNYFPNDFLVDYSQAVEISIGFSAYKLPWEFMGSRIHRSYSRMQNLLTEVNKENIEDLFFTIHCETIDPRPSSINYIAKLWDRIALTEYEELIADILRRVLKTQIERIAIVGNQGNSIVSQRRFLVRLRNDSTPIPLNSLGNGATRLFGLVLSIINCENGILLIDEVENGIHFSIQDKFWKIIFELANLCNVQVIATTHSFDSIKGFAEAMNYYEDTDVALIRLYYSRNQVRAYEFDRKDINSATANGIEVR